MNRLGLRNPAFVANAWSPARIANLAGFFHFTEGNCYVSNGGAATDLHTGGSPNPNEIVGYVPSLFGAPLSLSQVTGADKPMLRADGLMIYDAGDFLALSSPFVAGEATMYLAFTCPSLRLLIALGNSDETKAFLYFAGTQGYQDDMGGGDTIGSVPDGSLTLFRFESTATGGDIRTDHTGEGPVIQISGRSTFTFDQVGRHGTVGVGSGGYDTEPFGGGADIHIRLLILINRHIAYNSAEDVRIRNWIAANDGASL